MISLRFPSKEIPPHDILCAGFPCQPFSQAGKRQGFSDEKERGNLFNNICDILRYRRPKYVMLENVSNLIGHDHGRTWRTMYNKLSELEYIVKNPQILSPHEFGLAQHRRRIYIVAIDSHQGNLDYFNFPPKNGRPCDITIMIEKDATQVQKLKPDTRYQLSVWQEFLDLTIKHGESIPTYPVWAMEFGANYDFDNVAPAFQPLNELQGRKGKLGQIVKGETTSECLSWLPIYAQSANSMHFPNWKIRYIKSNRDFYNRNKEWLDIWLQKVQKFNNSHLKLEWNCGADATPIIEDKIVQFRASGIRIKLPTFSPALNLIGTQIPIFPWVPLPKEILKDGEPEKGRFMTVREAAKIQGMQKLDFGELSTTRTFEALGNAVNVTIIKHIAKNLLRYE